MNGVPMDGVPCIGIGSPAARRRFDVPVGTVRGEAVPLLTSHLALVLRAAPPSIPGGIDPGSPRAVNDSAAARNPYPRIWIARRREPRSIPPHMDRASPRAVIDTRAYGGRVAASRNPYGPIWITTQRRSMTARPVVHLCKRRNEKSRRCRRLSSQHVAIYCCCCAACWVSAAGVAGLNESKSAVTAGALRCSAERPTYSTW